MYCGNNQLSKLDVRQNTALDTLFCENNQLSQLDMSENSELTDLNCSENRLTTLDLRKNTELTRLECDNNQLTVLNIETTAGLEALHCRNNRLTSLDLSSFDVALDDMDEFDAIGNKYDILLNADNAFDLNSLPGNFEITRASNWTNGTVKGNTLTVTNPKEQITYDYDTGFANPEGEGNIIVRFTLIPSGGADPDAPADGGDTDAAADNIKGALSAVVVGAAAGVIIYEAGTGIYRVINMPGIPMPSNRIELAELLWEHAGKPEPVSTALYSDIDEDDTDAQKAAHWAVELDLMQDDSEKNTFNPHFPVSKLRTCLTWNAAKEKGLFDTDKPAE